MIILWLAPISTLFPYTTLFRSGGRTALLRGGRHSARGDLDHARGERADAVDRGPPAVKPKDRKSTRLNSSHSQISYAVFGLKRKFLLSPYKLPMPNRQIFSGEK